MISKGLNNHMILIVANRMVNIGSVRVSWLGIIAIEDGRHTGQYICGTRYDKQLHRSPKILMLLTIIIAVMKHHWPFWSIINEHYQHHWWMMVDTCVHMVIVQGIRVGMSWLMVVTSGTDGQIANNQQELNNWHGQWWLIANNQQPTAKWQ